MWKSRQGMLPLGEAYQRRCPRSDIDQHCWVFQRSSRVLEDHRETPQPRHRLARLVESGFAQDRVAAALVAVDDDPFRLDVDSTFHDAGGRPEPDSCPAITA